MRLTLEPLEAREVPANFVVDTLQDVVNPNDMVTSLREAIISACQTGPGNHNISFGQAQQGGTITLDPGQNYRDLKALVNVGVSGVNVTINGSATGVTIERDANTEVQHRLITAGEGVSLNLVNLNLARGAAALGGAVSSHGDLSVQGCHFTANGATDIGGAIHFNGGTLLVGSSLFTGNASASAGGAISIGSLVHTVGIGYSTFSGNAAGSDGGAVFVLGSNTATQTVVQFTGVTMYNNEAGERGGAIHVSATNPGTGTDVVFVNTILDNNRLTNPNPQFVTKGGGIYFGKGTLTATSLTLSYNDAKKGDGIYLVVPGSTLIGTPVYINDTKEEGTI